MCRAWVSGRRSSFLVFSVNLLFVGMFCTNIYKALSKVYDDFEKVHAAICYCSCSSRLNELQSKLLKGGHIGDYTGDYYKG